MSRNLEVKLELDDRDQTETLARRHFPNQILAFQQRDTYFRVEQGRFKLRQCPELGDELIYYERPDQARARLCRYWRQPTQHAEALKKLLERMCEVDVVVDKRRLLFRDENVRIHLDAVHELGDFLELEAVLPNSVEASSAESQLQAILRRLGTEHAPRVEHSYRELLLAKRFPESSR